MVAIGGGGCVYPISRSTPQEDLSLERPHHRNRADGHLEMRRFFPARVLRTFLKRVSTADGKRRNIPIQAIGLSLYEEVGEADGSSGLAMEEKLGKEVIRTQWLDFSTLGNRPLIGRRILIVVSPAPSIDPPAVQPSD